ncbi:hypothetical protein ALC60_00899, partial [Trachymyrmex zeteki]
NDALGVEEYDLRRKSTVQQVGCDRATGRDSSAAGAAKRKERNRREIRKGGRERSEKWETRDRGDRGERTGLVAGYAVAHTCANAAWHGVA